MKKYLSIAFAVALMVFGLSACVTKPSTNTFSGCMQRPYSECKQFGDV